jgi:hypothetical protein
MERFHYDHDARHVVIYDTTGPVAFVSDEEVRKMADLVRDAMEARRPACPYCDARGSGPLCIGHATGAALHAHVGGDPENCERCGCREGSPIHEEGA